MALNLSFRSLILLAALPLLQVSSLFAQNEKGVFDPAGVKRYARLEGLPQNSVNDFCFDNLGYMWIATWDGLSRFDGQHFKNDFGYNSTIPLKAKVVSFFKKNADTLYALTLEKKIFILTKGKIVAYETYSLKKHGLLLRYSQVAFPCPTNFNDSAVNNNNPKNTSHVQYPYEGFQYHQDSFGIIGSNLQLYNKHGLLKTLPLPYNGEKIYLLGKNLVTLNTSNNSLNLFSTNGVASHLALPVHSNTPARIYASLSTNAHFVANGSKLFEVKETENGDKIFFTKMLDQFEDSFHINRIYNLDGKYLIMSTVENGFFVCHKNSVQTFAAPVKSVNANNFYAQALMPDEKTVLTGINFLFDKTGYKGVLPGIINGDEPVYTDQRNISFLNRTIFKDRDNFYWYMAKEGNTVYLMKALNPGTSRAEKILPVTTEPIYCIFEDSKGHLWFNNNGILGYYDKTLAKYVPVQQDQGKDYLYTQTIRSYAEDNDGRILIGTTNGLYRYDPSQAHPVPQRYLLEGAAVHFLSVNKKNGSLWMGTYGKGLWIKKKNGDMIQLPMDKDNNMSTIHYVITDQHDRVWLSSNRGLYVTTKKAFDDFEAVPANKPFFYKFSTYHGFADDEFNAGCQLPMILHRDGSLTVSSVAGLAWLNTNDVSFDFSGTTLHTLVSYGQSIVQDEIENIDIEAGDEKELLIDVIAPDWGPYYNTQLQYKITKRWGNDAAPWQDINDQRQIAFPFFAAGDYTITIRKRTGFNDTDFIYHSLKVHKKPYWYQTLYLYPVMLLTLAFVGYLVYLWRILTLRRKNHVLKQKIIAATSILKEKNEALENAVQTRDSLILLFNHDLSTPLFYINQLAKTLVMQERAKGGDGSLIELLADSTQDLEEMMNDMLLWIQIQQKNISIQLMNEPVKLVEQVEKNFRLFEYRLEQNKIKTSILIDNNLVVYADRRVLNSILYNIMTNAIKYTQNGIIQLKVKEDSLAEGKLNLIVSSKSNSDELSDLPVDWENSNPENKTGNNSMFKNEQSRQIGLQLVKSFATMLNIDVSFDNTQKELFVVRIAGLKIKA